jgi:D-alanyl-D-alanine dipeptidase
MKQFILSLITGGYMLSAFANTGAITLISDPKVQAIPIAKLDEPWVDLRQENLIAIGPSPEIPNNQDYTFLRKAVYEKLKAAQEKLPKGLHFCLYEGYRSLGLQRMLFEAQLARVRQRHPKWTKEQVFLETTKLVSPVLNPDKSPNIPPHSTGAALDVYLLNEQGKPLDMGIHPKDWIHDVGGVLSLTQSRHISKAARKNRQIMSDALEAQGFVNYPTEYWHWSFGDKYWAYIKQQSHALYGTGTPHAS